MAFGIIRDEARGVGRLSGGAGAPYDLDEGLSGCRIAGTICPVVRVEVAANNDTSGQSTTIGRIPISNHVIFVSRDVRRLLQGRWSGVAADLSIDGDSRAMPRRRRV